MDRDALGDIAVSDRAAAKAVGYGRQLGRRVARVTVRAVDNGGTASGGSDSSMVRTFTINIL